MKIMIVVGMPGAGKNIAREVADLEGLPYFATGDLVRAELKRRGAPGPEETAAVSTELRGSDGMGVTRLALQAALQSREPLVVMEGMRSWPEIELIREQAEGIVVAFLAPRRTRLARILVRGREDDAPSSFAARDWREIEYGAAAPIALADEYILNTGSLAEAIKTLREIVARYASRDD